MNSFPHIILPYYSIRRACVVQQRFCWTTLRTHSTPSLFLNIGALVHLVAVIIHLPYWLINTAVCKYRDLSRKVSERNINKTKRRLGPDPDDTLDQKYTDVTGSFELNGYTHELTPIDPVLYVWHECRDEDTPCRRKLKVKLW